MKVLDKLKMPSYSDDEFPDEYDAKFDRELDVESDDEFEPENPHRDPVPGEASKRPRAAAPRAARTDPPRVTKKHRDEAAEEIETFIEMLALAWGWQAPPCGEALEQAAPDIAQKVTRLLARNPKWLLRVREGGILADAVGIAIAFKPVVQTAWTHYSQPVGGDTRGGVEFDPSRFAPYDGSGISR